MKKILVLLLCLIGAFVAVCIPFVVIGFALGLGFGLGYGVW